MEEITHIEYPLSQITPSTLVTNIINCSPENETDLTNYNVETHDLVYFDGEYIKDSHGNALYKVQFFQSNVIVDNIPNLIDSEICMPDDYISDEYLTVENGLESLYQGSDYIQYKTSSFFQEDEDGNWCNIQPNALLNISPIIGTLNIDVFGKSTTFTSETELFINEPVWVEVEESNILYPATLIFPKNSLPILPSVSDEIIDVKFYNNLEIQKSTTVTNSVDGDGNPIQVESEEEHIEIANYTSEDIAIYAYRLNATDSGLYLRIYENDDVITTVQTQGIFQDIKIHKLQNGKIIISGRSLRQETGDNFIGEKLGLCLINLSKSTGIWETYNAYLEKDFDDIFFNYYQNIEDKQLLDDTLDDIYCMSLYQNNTNSLDKYCFKLQTINQSIDSNTFSNITPSIEYFTKSISNLIILNKDDIEYKLYLENGSVLKIKENLVQYINGGNIIYKFSNKIDSQLPYHNFPIEDLNEVVPTNFKACIIDKPELNDFEESISSILTVFRFNENNNTKKVILNAFYKKNNQYLSLNENNINLVYEYLNETTMFYPKNFTGNSNPNKGIDFTMFEENNIAFLKSNEHLIKIDFNPVFDNLFNIKDIFNDQTSNEEEYSYLNKDGFYEAQIKISTYELTEYKITNVYRLPYDVQIETWVQTYNDSGAPLNPDFDTKQATKLIKCFKIPETGKLVMQFNYFGTDTREIKYLTTVQQNPKNIISDSGIQCFINLRKHSDPVIDSFKCIEDDPIIINI